MWSGADRECSSNRHSVETKKPPQRDQVYLSHAARHQFGDCMVCFVIPTTVPARKPQGEAMRQRSREGGGRQRQWASILYRYTKPPAGGYIRPQITPRRRGRVANRNPANRGQATVNLDSASSYRADPGTVHCLESAIFVTANPVPFVSTSFERDYLCSCSKTVQTASAE